VAVEPVDAGGEWSSGSSEGHTLAIELRAPTMEAALARAVEGFADVLGEVHPSVSMDQHELDASGSSPSALLLVVLEECLRCRRDGRLAVTLTDVEQEGDDLRATVHSVPVDPEHDHPALGPVVSWHEVTLEPSSDGDWYGRIVAR
jgi:SHS2 domain-containing protein